MLILLLLLTDVTYRLFCDYTVYQITRSCKLVKLRHKYVVLSHYPINMTYLNPEGRIGRQISNIVIGSVKYKKIPAHFGRHLFIADAEFIESDKVFILCPIPQPCMKTNFLHDARDRAEAPVTIQANLSTTSPCSIVLTYCHL